MAWELIDDDATYRLVCAADSGSGGGKTYFACTAPAPNYILTLDPNTRQVVRKYRQRTEPGKKIYVQQFVRPMPSLSIVSHAKGDVQDSEAQDRATDQWNLFVDTIGELIEKLKAKPRRSSITIDTASEFRGMQMMAEFGKNVQIPQHLYTKPNLAFQNIINTMKEELPLTNILLLHRLKDKYVDDAKVTGNPLTDPDVGERDGFNKTSYITDVEVRLFKDKDIKLRPKDGQTDDDVIGDRFGLHVVKSTERPSLEGRTWMGRSKRGTSRSSFTWLAMNVFPDSTAEDWA